MSMSGLLRRMNCTAIHGSLPGKMQQPEPANFLAGSTDEILLDVSRKILGSLENIPYS
jgi:hypothetical protein